MKQICIIGASGFVGSRLIEQLGKDNCHNIDKNPSANYPEITTIQNICTEGLMEAIPSSTETIVLLAAEHRDDVSPTSLYYDVNVQGTRNVLDVMDKKGIKNIIFTSSVAVYGLDKVEPNEKSPVDPFNHYGKSKWQAEEVLREWYQKDEENRSLTIIRPTVIFGENNRGNVYNLLKQIASGRFLMVGSGKNFKSMSYVGNVAAFIAYSIDNRNKYQLLNYVDKPDTNMLDLIKQVEMSLKVKVPSIKIPYFLGMICGYSFDILALITRKKYSISSIRIKKFCATTSISSIKITQTSFLPPFNIYEGLDKTLKNEF
ncbi:MAG: NAD-dependent epimerase/dehydratase family protein [Bacteroidales bacterium]